MSAGSVRVVNATLRLAISLILPGAAGIAASAAELANQLFDATTTRDDKKKVVRFIEDLQDTLEDRLDLLDRDFRSLEPGDKTQAFEAAIAALTQAQLDYGEIAATNFDGSYIERKALAVLAPELDERKLSGTSKDLARIIVRASCGDLAAILRTIPGGDKELLLRTFITVSQNSERLEDALRRNLVPKLRAGTGAELVEFTYSYLNSVMNSYGQLEQFGLQGVPPAFRWQPLDVTYISVSASIPSRSSDLVQASFREVSPMRHASKNSMPVEEAIGHALNISRTPSASGFYTTKSVPGLRLLISGSAGSGKTTIGHWLATRCARSHEYEAVLPDQLRRLVGNIPFVITLRDHVPGSRKSLYDDSEIISISSTYKDVPSNWLDSILKRGRAFLIIDGLDEISVSERSALLGWLRTFTTRHTRCNVLITSRPEGDTAALAEMGFAHLVLQPLASAQIQECVSRWFSARIASAPGSDVPIYRRAHEQLHTDIDRNANLRELANSPLLTALLCAYYANGVTHAPVSRSALIRHVAAVLVHAREHERGSIPPDIIHYAVEHKLELLNIVAKLMFTYGVSTVQIDNEQIAKSLESSTLADELSKAIRGDVASPLLFRYLAERSVVFSKVSASEAQFIHRYFLEYFAAHAFVNSAGGRSELAQHRGLPGWYDVVAHYCAIAPKHAAEGLLLHLLDLIESSDMGSDRKRLIYAAVESAGAIKTLKPGLQSRLGDVLQEIVPPGDEREVSLLAGLGPTALRVLQSPLTVSEAAASVRTASKVGGSDALDVLSSIATGPHGDTAAQLMLDCWHRFDIPNYARRVLAHLDLSGHTIRIDSEEQLRALSALHGRRHIQVGSMDADRIAATLGEIPEIAELDLSHLLAVPSSWEFLGNLPQLRRLGLPVVNRAMDTLKRIARLSELYIRDASAISTLDDLPSLPMLHTLAIGRFNAALLSANNRALPKLRHLTLDDGDLASLVFVRPMHLASIKLGQGVALPGDWTPLRECAELTRLCVAGDPRRKLEIYVPASGELRHVDVSGSVSLRNPEDMSKHIQLRFCAFRGGIMDIGDLAMFASMEHLRTLIIPYSFRLRSLYGIQRLSRLNTLDITGSAVESLQDDDTATTPSDLDQRPDGGRTGWNIRQLKSLKELTVDECLNLTDINILAGCQELRRVSLLRMNRPRLAEWLSTERPEISLLEDDWWFDPGSQIGG